MTARLHIAGRSISIYDLYLSLGPPPRRTLPVTQQRGFNFFQFGERNLKGSTRARLLVYFSEGKKIGMIYRDSMPRRKVKWILGLVLGGVRLFFSRPNLGCAPSSGQTLLLSSALFPLIGLPHANPDPRDPGGRPWVPAP